MGCCIRYVWDVSRYKYSEQYFDSADQWGNGPFVLDAPVPEKVHAEAWRQVEELVGYMKAAHKLKMQGIVAEFLLADNEQVVLHSVLEVSWASGAQLWKGLTDAPRTQAPKSAAASRQAPRSAAASRGQAPRSAAASRSNASRSRRPSTGAASRTLCGEHVEQILKPNNKSKKVRKKRKAASRAATAASTRDSSGARPDRETVLDLLLDGPKDKKKTGSNESDSDEYRDTDGEDIAVDIDEEPVSGQRRASAPSLLKHPQDSDDEAGRVELEGSERRTAVSDEQKGGAAGEATSTACVDSDTAHFTNSKAQPQCISQSRLLPVDGGAVPTGYTMLHGGGGVPERGVSQTPLERIQRRRRSLASLETSDGLQGGLHGGKPKLGGGAMEKTKRAQSSSGNRRCCVRGEGSG